MGNGRSPINKMAETNIEMRPDTNYEDPNLQAEEETDMDSFLDDHQETQDRWAREENDSWTVLDQEQDNLEAQLQDKIGKRKDKRTGLTRELKAFFRIEFKRAIAVKDGPASKKIIVGSEFSFNENTHKVNGIIFQGEKIIVTKGKRFKFSDNKLVKKKLSEFHELLRTAEEEHNNTAAKVVETAVGGLMEPEVTEQIIESVGEQIQEYLGFELLEIEMREIPKEQGTEDEQREEGVMITEQELREFGGLLKNATDKVAVDIERQNWKEKADKEVDLKRKAFFRNMERLTELKIDQLRFQKGLRPLHEKLTDMLDNNDFTKLERFKVWARNNLGTLAAIAITVAGIIVTVIVAGRKAIVTGAKATGAVAKSLAKLAKTALPILTPLIGFLGTMLSWGAKGLAFVAQNLWMLAVGFSFLIYKFGTSSLINGTRLKRKHSKRNK